MKNCPDGLGECALHGVVGRWFAVDPGDDVASFQSGSCAGSAGNYGLDLQILRVVIKQEAGAIEDVGFAITRVFLEIHFAVGTVEDDRELSQDMEADVAGDGGG